MKLRFLLLAPQAIATCVHYRIALAFRRVEVLNRKAPALQARIAWPSESEISRAVHFAARILPGVHCLPQALAVRELMHRYGRPCDLRIGVATAGGFRAHAWVESDGRIVHGQTGQTFAALQ